MLPPRRRLWGGRKEKILSFVLSADPSVAMRAMTMAEVAAAGLTRGCQTEELTERAGKEM